MNNFKTLEVWQRSISITREIYKKTALLPTRELYGLRSQINRAAISIASNVAEGAGRDSDKQYCYFLNVAIGSAFELETQLILCCELQYFKQSELQDLLDSIGNIQRMLYGLYKQKSGMKKMKQNQLTLIALIVSVLGLIFINYLRSFA